MPMVKISDLGIKMTLGFTWDEFLLTSSWKIRLNIVSYSVSSLELAAKEEKL